MRGFWIKTFHVIVECEPHKLIQILRILCRQSNKEIPDPQPPLGKIWDVMSQKRHHPNEMWQLCDVVCIKCKETFLGKDTFQIWYRCRGGGGGARRGTLILISPETMEHFLLWRGNCRGPKSCNIGGNPETTKTAESDVWKFGRILHMSPQRCQPVARVLLQIDNYFKLPISFIDQRDSL